MAQLLFRVHRTELLSALSAVSGAVARKDEIPVLQNVLLQPHGERLVVRGTDLNIEIQTSCDLLDDGNGETLTIGFKELYDITKNLPESAEISIHEGKAPGQVAISGGRSKYNLHFLPASGFPSMGKELPPFAFAISAAVLNVAFKKILYAVNVEMKDRPYLMGAYLHSQENGKIAVVGCNGLKLAVSRVSPAEAVNFHAPIIPTETVKAFCKLMGESKELCRFYINENRMVIECGDVVIVSRLVDGVFPVYQRIIPAKHEVFIRADRDALIRAISRVTAISSNIKTSATKFFISSGQLQIELVTTNGQAAVETLDIEHDGEDFRRGFNGSFVKDTLESISTASFRLFGTDPEAPGHFTPDNDDADEDYIVMPMRV